MLKLHGTQGLVIALWTEAPNMTELCEMEEAGLRQQRINGGKAALMNVVVSGQPIFPEDIRTKCKEMISQGRPFNWAVAHLILLGGVAGAGVRAFLTASALFASKAIPKRAFGQRGDACVWMAKQLGKGWSVEKVEQTLAVVLPRHSLHVAR
jgi:hypothetical protein